MHCSSHWLFSSDKGRSNSRTWARPSSSSIDTFSISHPACTCTLVVFLLVNQSFQVAATSAASLLTRARLMGTLKHRHRVHSFSYFEEVSELDRRWSKCYALFVRKLTIEGSISILIEWMPISLSLPVDRLYWISSVWLQCLASLGLLICPNLITPSIMWFPAKIRMCCCWWL